MSEAKFTPVTRDRGPQIPRGERPLWGLLCNISCGFAPRSDDKALWGECARCGAVAGYIERYKVRAYIEREDHSHHAGWRRA